MIVWIEGGGGSKFDGVLLWCDALSYCSLKISSHLVDFTIEY
jgi:hypothetical protein